MALAKTDILTPCWSCEGHARSDGSLHRPPQVWFYCRSLPAIAVLDEAIQSLTDAKQLSTRWRIRALSGLPRTENAFALEPEADIHLAVTLYQLQVDAERLADRLPAALRASIQNHGLDLTAGK